MCVFEFVCVSGDCSGGFFHFSFLDLFLPAPSSCICPLALDPHLPNSALRSHLNPTHSAPGMASILMSAVGLGVHFTSALLPQQPLQQQQPAPFSLPPPVLPPASRPSNPHSSSSNSVRRAKRQHRRGSYHATIPFSSSFPHHFSWPLITTGFTCTCTIPPSFVIVCMFALLHFVFVKTKLQLLDNSQIRR